MAILDSVSGITFIFLILSLAWLAGHFLLDSTGFGFKAETEDKPLSRNQLLADAAIWAALSFGWVYTFVREWNRAEPSTFFLIGSVVAGMCGILLVIQRFRAAMLAK